MDNLLTPLQQNVGTLSNAMSQQAQQTAAVLSALQQNQLQQQQLQQQHLQLQQLHRAAGSSAFGPPPGLPAPAVAEGSPNLLLKRLDNALAEKAKEARNKISRRMKLLFEHKEQARRFEEKIPKRFMDESKLGWQFPKEYVAIAKAVEAESEEQLVDMSETYDVDRAWKRLRHQHAAQCTAFLKQHSLRMVEEFTASTTPSAVLAEAQRELTTFWETPAGKVYGASEQEHFSKIFTDFLVLHARQAMTFHQQQWEKQKDNLRKRDEALHEAQALHEQADVETLISMAKLAEGGRDTYPEGSIMHFLHSKQPEVLESFKKHMKKQGGKRDTSRNKKGDGQRGRSPAKRNTKKTTQKVKFRKTPAPSRENSGGSRRSSSRGSSKNSQSSGSGRSSAPRNSRNGKGKGKGKKGRRRGRGKGAGKR